MLSILISQLSQQHSNAQRSVVNEQPKIYDNTFENKRNPMCCLHWVNDTLMDLLQHSLNFSKQSSFLLKFQLIKRWQWPLKEKTTYIFSYMFVLWGIKKMFCNCLLQRKNLTSFFKYKLVNSSPFQNVNFAFEFCSISSNKTTFKRFSQNFCMKRENDQILSAKQRKMLGNF